MTVFIWPVQTTIRPRRMAVNSMHKTSPKLLYLLVGARPNFMKVAPIVRVLKGRERHLRREIIHSGQRYDRERTDVFFEEPGIPQPDHHLNCEGGSHAEQAAKIMGAFEAVCQQKRRAGVLMLGNDIVEVRGKAGSRPFLRDGHTAERIVSRLEAML